MLDLIIVAMAALVVGVAVKMRGIASAGFTGAGPHAAHLVHSQYETVDLVLDVARDVY